MALIDEIKEQTVKIKDMDTKGKIDYIWHYYKWYMIGFIFVVGCLISIASEVVRNNKPVYLFAEFINCNLAYDDTSTMKDDFIKYVNADEKETKFEFDYGTILQDSAFDANANYATVMRIMAEYNAKTLDVVCAPESVLSETLNIGAYGNFEELLPAGMIDDLKAKGYELWTYTEYDEEDPEVAPKSYIAGFYIDNCEYMKKQGKEGVYTTVNGDRPILTISCTSQNPEHCVEFIRMITE